MASLQARIASLLTSIGADIKALNTALAAKAPLASPALTGVPTAPSPAPGTNNTQIATTDFVQLEAAPTGAISLWPTATAPSQWVLCKGQGVARVGTYAGIFAVIGTTYGAGDGSTTFNLPDFQSRFVMGAGLHAAVGANEGASSEATRNTGFGHSHAHTGPSHTHTGPSHAHTSAGHTHTSAAHTHTSAAHTHPGGAHTHGVAIGVAVNTTASGGSTRVTTINGSSTTGTSPPTDTGTSGTTPTGSTTPADTGSTTPAATGSTTPVDTGAAGTGATGAAGNAATTTNDALAIGNNEHPFLSMNFIMKL